MLYILCMLYYVCHICYTDISGAKWAHTYGAQSVSLSTVAGIERATFFYKWVQSFVHTKRNADQ